MKICRTCGAANAQNGKFCEKCGAAILEEPEGTVVTCQVCSTPNAFSARFCYKCGQALPVSSQFCNACGAENAPVDIYCGKCGSRIILEAPKKAFPMGNNSSQGVPTKQAPVAAAIQSQPQEISKKQKKQKQADMPVSKKGYRIQLIISLLLIAGMGYLLMFANAWNDALKSVDLTFMSVFNVLPNGLKEQIAPVLDIFGKIFPNIWVDALAGSLMTFNMGTLLMYLIGFFTLLGVVVLVFGFVVTLFRVLFNKPYPHTRKIYVWLFIINLVLGALAWTSGNVEFMSKLFKGVNLEPGIFFYLTIGGYLLLAISTRISSRKTK